ncbi:hypothetical protein GCM10010232_69820 [Streptomyces amakusaensis]
MGLPHGACTEQPDHRASCRPGPVQSLLRADARPAGPPRVRHRPRAGDGLLPGGGFLELSGRAADADGSAAAGVELWLQVEDAAPVHAELSAGGAEVLRPPVREPWGLVEMWLAEPDGHRIGVVEVPEGHPLRYRP